MTVSHGMAIDFAEPEPEEIGLPVPMALLVLMVCVLSVFCAWVGAGALVRYWGWW